MSTKIYVSYGETKSANYNSRKYEFGFQVEASAGADVSEAQRLCEAVVKARLGVKIGLRKSQLDDLSKQFFNCTWQELTTGVKEGDEEL